MRSRLATGLGLLGVLASGSPQPVHAGPFPAAYPPEAAYSVGLHVHGSVSEQFGSMEWGTALADSAGIDVIWWTDHDWRLSLFRHMTEYNFENTTWNGSRWTEPDPAFPGESKSWVPAIVNGIVLSTVVDTLAHGGTKSLRLEANGPGGASFQGEYLSQKASELQNRYPLGMRVKLSFAILPEALDPVNSRFVMEVNLSDHPDGTHVLRYVLGSMTGEGVHSIPIPHSLGTWNEIELNVTADAITHFGLGGLDSLRAEDNTLGVVRIGLETRLNAVPVVFFDDYEIATDTTMVDDVMLDKARDIASYYESGYPSVQQLVGYEVSHFKGQPHLNGFAPNITVVDYAGHVWSDSLYYAVDHIHAQGGAVSLNHTYGPNAPIPPESQAQKAARLDFTKRSRIASRALNVDVLEVGYRSRGGMNLRDHLDLWDALNSNAVFLTGNGVTDTHGRGWAHLPGWVATAPGDSTTNNFTTWLWTETPDEVGFVRSMKSGRAYFGDPTRFDGTLDLQTVDGFRMGQVVFTDRDLHDLVVTATDVPSDVQVRLLQIEIQEYDGVGWPQYYVPNILRDEQLTLAVSTGAFSDTVSVDTETPCLVRCELYDGSGDELVFSNPIHFVHDVPALGIPAPRVAARIVGLGIFLAEDFTLTGASFDPATGSLTVTGDETAPGLGQLWIDPGPFGAPGSVSGAQSWNFSNGVLTVSGFSGSGSTANVIWGPTGADVKPGIAAERRLEPGRPNPFGEGTLTEYAIPREGWVRLEVLDVTGRRVRVLDLGFREAGVHRIRWDGADELGTAVAPGVYYLRLEHEGESLVRKAVRIR